jgi:hypothetical protein
MLHGGITYWQFVLIYLLLLCVVYCDFKGCKGFSRFVLMVNECVTHFR